jgi:hypothetical protein
MPCLTELSVGFGDEDGTPVDLVSFLVACPSSMKALAINYNRMVVKPHNIILESIETLSIICITLGDIISSCFPNLVKLSLYFMHLHNTNITLKILQFQHATLCRDGVLVEYGGKFGVSFKLSNQTEAH